MDKQHAIDELKVALENFEPTPSAPKEVRVFVIAEDGRPSFVPVSSLAKMLQGAKGESETPVDPEPAEPDPEPEVPVEDNPELEEPQEPQPEPSPEPQPEPTPIDPPAVNLMPKGTRRAFAVRLEMAPLKGELKRRYDATEAWLVDFYRRNLAKPLSGEPGTFGLKDFRATQPYIHTSLLQTRISGQVEPVLRLARLWKRLIAMTVTESRPLTGLTTYAKDYRAQHDQVGLRRWLASGTKGPTDPRTNTDNDALERALTEGLMGQSALAMYENREAHPEIAEGFELLFNLIKTDWQPRNEYLSRAYYGAAWRTHALANKLSPDEVPPYLYNHTVAHAVRSSYSYYRCMFRITGDVRFRAAAQDLKGHLRTSEHTYTAPDGRMGLVFNHGVNTLRAVKGQGPEDYAHPAVYMRESLPHMVIEALMGGGLYNSAALEQLGATLYHCVPIDGPEAASYAGDMQGGGYADRKDRHRVSFRDGSSVPCLVPQTGKVGEAPNRHGVHAVQWGLTTLPAAWSDIPGHEAELTALSKRAEYGRHGISVTLLALQARKEGRL